MQPSTKVLASSALRTGAIQSAGAAVALVTVVKMARWKIAAPRRTNLSMFVSRGPGVISIAQRLPDAPPRHCRPKLLVQWHWCRIGLGEPFPETLDPSVDFSIASDRKSTLSSKFSTLAVI